MFSFWGPPLHPVPLATYLNGFLCCLIRVWSDFGENLAENGSVGEVRVIASVLVGSPPLLSPLRGRDMIGETASLGNGTRQKRLAGSSITDGGTNVEEAILHS